MIREIHSSKRPIRESLEQIDGWISPELRAEGRIVLLRARMTVLMSGTIATLATIYAAVFVVMDGTPCSVTCLAGTCGAIMSIVLVRFSQAGHTASQLLIFSIYAPLTVLATQLGGHGAPSLAWYMAIPVISQCTASTRTAVGWTVVIMLSLSAFYLLNAGGYPLPNEISPENFDLLNLLSLIGLASLILYTALLYEATNVELEHTRNEADAANRAKSEFLANMSHEIRTPMTAILGFSDVLLESPSDLEKKNAIGTIRRNGEYLLKIINDILDLSKIEAGKFDVERIPCCPRNIIAEVANLMRIRANAKNLPLNIEFDGPIPETVETDSTRLRQILINVLGNAIKFTETGEVRLVTRLVEQDTAEPVLQFEVTDTGIGIGTAEIERLFQPFSQADGSMTRRFGGTGLGLAICKRLAQSLGGDITATSELGVGSRFTIHVATGAFDRSRLIQAPTISQTPSAASSTDEGAEVMLSGYHLLLAEDGPDNQRLISFVLRKAGAHVDVVDNGQLAWEQAMRALDSGVPFDVILMDMQMPVLDGYEATRKLREDGYRHPIVALTAHAMSHDRDKCLEAGCDDYATKPLDRAKLLSIVAQYTQRSPVEV